MCCGSKRSAWRSAPASTPQPRAAPAPVAAKPTPAPARPNTTTQEAEGGRAAGRFHSSASEQDAPLARPVRRWGLTS